MRMRTGTELIARGRVLRGSRASAAVVPTSSTPTNAKTAIWNPATTPMAPCGNHPPSFHRFAICATWPSGDVKCVSAMTTPVTISARMATILMSANQNSISPKFFTLTALSRKTTASTTTVGSHSGTEGHQNCM